jgi:hypothetical protein
MYDLLRDGVISIQALDGAADNETLTGSGVDMLDGSFNSVLFAAGGVKGAELEFNIKVFAAAGPTFANEIELDGSDTDFEADVYTDGVVAVQVHNPQQRYLRPKIVVPNVQTGIPIFCVAIRYNSQYKPADAGDATLVSLVSPVEVVAG